MPPGGGGAALDGVLVLDKPAGRTSHDVVAVVRRAAGQRKVGHAGTLDPDATGVLVVCLGRATRLVPYLQSSTKTYSARMRLGVTTTSLDASGDVVAERDASAVTSAQLQRALAGFVGKVEQVPPMVSAVKIGGERLYAKARRGEEVERPARQVTISQLMLLAFPVADGRPAGGLPAPTLTTPEADLVMRCSPGTYVRTLVADVGETLGVGACLTRLRRTASGRFSSDGALDVDTVVRLGEEGRLGEVLLTPAQAIADLPARLVDAGEADDLGHGRAVAPSGRPGPVAAMDSDGRLLAVVEDRDGRACPRVVLVPAAGGQR